MPLNSLRSRMTAAFALAFAVLVCLFSGLFLWFSRHAAETNAETVMQAEMNRLQHEYTEAQREHDPWNPVEEPNDLAKQNLALILFDSQGEVLQKSPANTSFSPENGRQDNWRMRQIVLGSMTAAVGYDWRPAENSLRFQMVSWIALSLLLFLAATFGVWILVGWTLTPIYGLSVEAEAASTDHLRVQLHAPSHDAEIVHLVGTLNALLERLAGAASARERFYAAASHELRTPLQTLTGSLELALMRPRTESEYRAALEDTFSQSKRLSSLVQALLLLNQLEAAPARDKERVNLTEVCDRWLREFKPLANERGLRIRNCLPDDLSALAIPSHADILTRNLIENALKYALPGSEIMVHAITSETETRLNLVNACAPFTAEEAAKLFEPFYRPDASRNSQTGGNGLGLAICRAVAAANGWKLMLLPEQEGLRVEVILAA